LRDARKLRGQCIEQMREKERLLRDYIASYGVRPSGPPVF